MIVQNALLTEDIPEKGVVDGHLRFSFTSAAPADVMAVGMCANLAATLLFERLHAQGTNLILSLRKDGGRADVVARNANDGLGIEWQPTQADPAALDDARARIAERFAPPPPPPPARVEMGKEPTRRLSEDDEESGKEDEYLIKQLTRIP